MTDFLLRNSLNPNKVISCTISIRQLVNKGDEGEPVWLIEVRTVEPHKDGGSIAPVYIHYTNSQNIDEAISAATEQIAAQVDWAPLSIDIKQPFIVSGSPTGDDVSIYSNININIKDSKPSSGIDIDSIKVYINDIDVTDELNIDGDAFEYNIFWAPEIRILDNE